ncbi:hypothetical protein [Nocardioides nitrophenolicus]|uniref:hypothetical protein n=1 Tax=Nocardioides nitrophenolicus TaxID=60489 RepID=UPI00195D5863|nr:hypothetical protein [Nocardioides nitrophenolicus]MBM7516685.1 hypothetical protein [Nocardioides nitrophenolicus]
MNASLRVPWRSRRAAAVAAAVLGLSTMATAYVLAQDDVSGTDPGTSTDFTVVGDGELPTDRPALGADRAPLSAEETGYAIHLAESDASIPAGATDARGEAGPEFLYADLPDVGENLTGRKVVVALYDYTSDAAYDQLVDLETGKVVKSTTNAKAQPPTTANEADVAMEIAVASDLDLLFKSEFETNMGVPLIATDQVEYVAGAWVYDKTTSGGKECGTDRCAQLMVSTASGVYLNTWDFVVNLSTKSIVPTQ